MTPHCEECDLLEHWLGRLRVTALTNAVSQICRMLRPDPPRSYVQSIRVLLLLYKKHVKLRYNHLVVLIENLQPDGRIGKFPGVLLFALRRRFGAEHAE